MARTAEGPAGLIEQLPSRFTTEAGTAIDGRYRLHIGRTRRDVIVVGGACRVEKANGVLPDAEIRTDPDTWELIDQGRISGIEAFADRRLHVRGSISKVLGFEPMFERPAAGGMRYTLEKARTRNSTISYIAAGREGAPPLILLHGLGGTNSSWLTVLPALARRYRVLAIDFPGFGASSKPLGRYTAPWFAKHVFAFMDELGYGSSYVAGNSMGGRVAMEMAMLEPERVRAIACLCPAAAFSKRPGLLLAKLARPELGVVAARLPRSQLIEGLKDLFADPSRIDPEWFEAAIDDFLVTWRSPRARLAFFASLRNIYLDEPDGDSGFWTRLKELSVPALYLYGHNDRLITSRFGQRVLKTLSTATVEMWDDCGHVPQLEHPMRTAQLLGRFFSATPGAMPDRRAV
ncbi:MAG TPA: alpha/beta fold hydrolase [Actinomycetota bacterium]|nr:alpha/beta fold hydrolase [Actinomycetota bacterium]